MPANMENSAVATGLEKVSFHSNPKERQSQRMLKLPHNCIHLTPVIYQSIIHLEVMFLWTLGGRNQGYFFNDCLTQFIFFLIFFLFFFFICGGFCHTLKWNSHGLIYWNDCHSPIVLWNQFCQKPSVHECVVSELSMLFMALYSLVTLQVL